MRKELENIVRERHKVSDLSQVGDSELLRLAVLHSSGHFVSQIPADLWSLLQSLGFRQDKSGRVRQTAESSQILSHLWEHDCYGSRYSSRSEDCRVCILWDKCRDKKGKK